MFKKGVQLLNVDLFPKPLAFSAWNGDVCVYVRHDVMLLQSSVHMKHVYESSLFLLSGLQIEVPVVLVLHEVVSEAAQFLSKS